MGTAMTTSPLVRMDRSTHGAEHAPPRRHVMTAPSPRERADTPNGVERGVRVRGRRHRGGRDRSRNGPGVLRGRG